MPISHIPVSLLQQNATQMKCQKNFVVIIFFLCFAFSAMLQMTNGKISNLILEENTDSTMFKPCSFFSPSPCLLMSFRKMNALTQLRKRSRVKVVNINKKC